jgi:hypothetical protein
MSFLSNHRPTPEPPQPSTVVAEPATAENCAADYAERNGTTAPHPSSFDAAPHTHGRR